MRSVNITVKDKSVEYASKIDPFGVKAVNILADLFPKVRINVEYDSVSKSGKRFHSSSWSQDQNRLKGFDMDIPTINTSTNVQWFRKIELLMEEPSCSFLGFNNTHDKTPRENKQEIPRELEFALSICQDVSRAWCLNIADEPIDELILALNNELPSWICCHIIADFFYSFSNYGTNNRKHDILASTLIKTISYFTNLASSRVEHQQLSHAVIISTDFNRFFKPHQQSIYPEDFTKLKRTPLLSDGNQSVLLISPKGNPISLITSEWLNKHKRRKRNTFETSINQNLLSEASDFFNGLAVSLKQDGSLTVLYKSRPILIRRGGKWRGLLWGPIMNAMNYQYKELGKLVFDVALLLSSAGNGGIIGIFDKCPKGIHKKDVVFTNLNVKEYSEHIFHLLLPSKNAIELGPQVLSMLASIDGAVILNKSGDLLAYGAVVPSTPGGSV